MNVRQFNELDAARRGHTFLTVAPLPAPLGDLPPAVAQQIPVLGELVTTLDARASAQTAAGGAITDRASAAREAAHELHFGLLSPVKRAATLIGKSAAGGALSPEFARTITIPNTRSYPALLTAVSGAIESLTPYKALFASRGLPDDFLDRMVAQSTVLRQAIAATAAARAARVGMTTEVVGLLHEVRSVMHVLHMGVTGACKADRVNGPGVLAGWHSATAIRRIPVSTDIPFVMPAAGQPVEQPVLPLQKEAA